MGKVIRIQAQKYPNIPHYEWEGELLEHTDEYVLVLCKPGRKLIHLSKNQVFTINNTSLEFFSLKDWFTVAMQVEQGKITAYYCNVATPSKFGEILSFVDLDIDLVKERGKEWEVVDEEEFKMNQVKYQYPTEMINRAIATTAQLKQKALHSVFPFDETLLQVLNRINHV